MKRRTKMKKMNILLSGVALLIAAPAFASPDDNDGAKQTLTINEQTDSRTVSEIKMDGNNAVLSFTDGSALAVDMRLVSLTMSYDEATNISRLNMTDKSGSVIVYDLQGRKVANSKNLKANSLYIVNGKKVVNHNK